ncbi:MAG: hypothetical protein SGI84_00295 [Gemmatimonadota bacterium]|nr:hypothetical protein [Gemmatimonadota bacterium]
MPGCATVFPIPFLLGGLLALALGIPEAVDGRWTLAIILGGLGLAGIVVGLSLHFGFRRRAARERRLAQRQAAWPEEPWRWREDWADGPISDTSRQQVIASWFVAALWNAIALPSSLLAVREALRTGEPTLWLVTLFGAIGIGLLVHAIRDTLHHRRYGTSALELETFPGFLGGTLAGRIRASLDLHAAPRIPVSLRCIRVDEGETEGDVVWESQLDVVRTFRDGGSTVIHFAFRLPPEAPASSPLPGTGGVSWRLEANADIPGVDYRARFEVPVFAPPAGVVLTASDIPIAVGFDDYVQPPSSRILVTTTQHGTEVWLPAARHLVPALVVTASAVFFGGLGVFLLWTEAPQLLAWAVSLVGAAIGLAAASLWFGTSQILATMDGMEITQGFLGLGRTRHVPTSDVLDIATQTSMQANARYYADLALVRRSGGRVVLGRAIREKREAEWLADRLLRALGR